MAHREWHRAGRGGWLRAAVLGANDGIVSTASLVLGVAAADPSPTAIGVAGLAGLVGGSLSMAAGEWVSVSSQRDVEQADLALERTELATEPARELQELTAIYVDKGLTPALAAEVAAQLTAADALVAHAKEELNIDLDALAQPTQAAVTSAVSFAIGAAIPLAVVLLTPASARMPVTVVAAAVCLAALGALSANLGGAPIGRAVARVTVGGLLAMGLTMAIGALVGGGAAP